MKYVINGAYGGFEFPEEFLLKMKEDLIFMDNDEQRTDPLLIEIVESDEYKGDLTVVEIPDNATDFVIEEYDGCENILYVVDGKINYLS